eukprot:TRINITY_DN1634_c0_g1_i1.p1 TRINITY_DN1634_c0_g1~~TRINITY_DN1634_c0_g1_i1.p1  ORF type:complete len:568 (-),score=188.55 TRINITY_DN1634_c0_g1_i1:321-1985(-)
MKIIDKINKALEDEDAHLFSFEYFPPKTEDGVANLYRRLQSMATLFPAFIDVTWGAGGSTSERTLEIVSNAQKYLGLETMMHLTCTNMPVEGIHDALVKAKESGVQNILALRGDPPRGEDWKKIDGGFSYAEDLVKYIRAQFGDYFGIAVAGYPERHADSKSKDDDMVFLKKKIDAGADFIITQLFFDTKIFLDFVKDCREIGITCPIIPGIMPIHTYAGFKRMVSLCGTFVPPYVLDALEEVKDNDEAVKEFGVKLAIDMCQELLAAGIKGLHFYTLNLEKTVLQIVEGLKLTKESPRPLPWRTASTNNRVKEDVRPVFWSHRHQSYIKRTESWDEFPNGRWGDSRSPAFGELTDFHLAGVSAALSAIKERPWGTPVKNYADVQDIFIKYCKGELNELPWNDLPLSLESEKIRDWLIQLNSSGYLTINSQPSVNGVESSDPVHGWGGSDGWVYQKVASSNKDTKIAGAHCFLFLLSGLCRVLRQRAKAQPTHCRAQEVQAAYLPRCQQEGTHTPRANKASKLYLSSVTISTGRPRVWKRSRYQRADLGSLPRL